MSEEAIEYVDIVDRPFEQVVADLRRARRNHITSAHNGDAEACSCELVAFDANEEAVRVVCTFDVDGNPHSMAPSERHRITGAVWRAPKEQK